MKHCIIILALFFSLTIFSNPANLDSSFHGRNYSSISIGGQVPYSIGAVAIQSDGKTVVTGRYNTTLAFIARYNTDQTLDMTFNGTGYVIINLGSGAFSFFIPTDIIMQPNGQIVVAGYIQGSGVGLFYQAYITRYNSNGSLDTTFNTSTPGYTVIPYAMIGAITNVSIALQSTTNKIFATQSIEYTDTNSIFCQGTVVAAFNSNGTSAFVASGVNNNGITGDQYQIDGNPHYLLIAIGPACIPTAIANVGTTKTIIAGYESSRAFVARFNSSTGLFDATFGTGGQGFTTTAIGTRCTVTDMVLDSNNNIIITGYATIAGVNNIFVARYLASNGLLDTTFGTGGFVTSLIGSSCQANGIAIESNGTIVVTGTSGTNSIVAYFTSAGVLNTATIPNGYTLGLGGAANDIAIDSSNNIMITGTSYIDHYNATGYITAAIGTSSTANAITFDKNGNFIVAGAALNGYEEIVIARYTATGFLDSTFGAGIGYVTLSTGSNNALAYGVTVDANNNIVVAGVANNQIIIARYLPTGALDTTFNSTGSPAGIITYAIPSSTSCQANGIAIDANNNIVVTGVATISGVANIFLARYLPTGILDTNFNGTGYTTTLIGSACQANGIVMDANNNILITGYANISGSNNIIVARYLSSNGTADPAFTINPILATGSTSSIATSIALQLNGKIVVAGSAVIGGVSNIILARFLSDGSLNSNANIGDPANIGVPFGTNQQGYVTTLIASSTACTANAVVIDTFQNILITGQATISGVSQIVTARYLNAGSLDASFSTTGYTTTAAVTGNSSGNSILFQPYDQKIVVAGSGIANEILITRYLGGVLPTFLTATNLAHVQQNLNLYAANPTFLFNYINSYAIVITNTTVQAAVILAMNNLLNEYLYMYGQQINFNDIGYVYLFNTQLNALQASLLNQYGELNSGTAATQINSFFTLVNNNILNITPSF